MFGKNKKPDEPKKFEYTNWEKDLGFLQLILTREKNIVKEFVINVYSGQKDVKDYLSDKEIDPLISDIVETVISRLGDNYKDFLIEKYFGTQDSLISFISEDVYVDLISDSINRNNNKIKAQFQEKVIKDLNKSKKQTQEK